ncbi:hypothetical protein J4434_01275 [Candidatus Woesearchaeota archaeon]|nr:hypothetical protein [Candidatus Woesearchaeota archaeon]
MDRRRLLQIAVAGLVALATPQVVDKGLEMIASVSAEEKEKKPETVDDILAGTSFEEVCSDNYAEKTKYGNVVVFFYDKNDTNGASTRLAQVYRSIELEYKANIIFLKFGDSIQRKDSKKYVPEVPYTLFYKKGEIIDQLAGGPKEDFNLEIWTKDFRKGLDKLYK